MQKKLVIIGTGLFPEVACCYFEELAGYTVVAYACHRAYKSSDTIYGLPLHEIETLYNIHPPNTVEVFVAIGYGQMNTMRQKVYDEIKGLGYQCATFIHPSVKIWESTTLGDNVFICEDNAIQPFTKIGNNTVLWNGNLIAHHTHIGDHCFISSHVVVSGSCKVGNHVFIGVNATLHDSIEIGDQCLIGAGAILSTNTKAKEVYIPRLTKRFPQNSEAIGF